MRYPTTDPTALLQGGKFTDGDPLTATPASPDRAAYQNMVFDEILSVITYAGLTPSDDTTQLLQAIKLLIRPSNWIAAEKIGAEITLSGAGATAMGAFPWPSLSDSEKPLIRFALADGGRDAVECYEYNYTTKTCVLVGNSYSISGMSDPMLAVHSSNRVAVFDNTTNALQMLSWDGTDYAPVGSAYTVSGAGVGAMVFMSGNILAFADVGNDNLRCLSWDEGSTSWSAVGTPYALPSGTANLRLTRNSTTDISLCIDGKHLRRMRVAADFSWSQVAATSEYVGHGVFNMYVALAALNEFDTLVGSEGGDNLLVWRWMGNSSIRQASASTELLQMVSSLVALNGTDVIYLDSDQEKLGMVRMSAYQKNI